MSGLKKIVRGTLLVTVVLAFTHAWLNYKLNPLQLVGLKKKAVAEETKFRVGFLPVT